MVWMMLVFAVALGAFAVPAWWCLVLPVVAAVMSTATHDGTRSIIAGKVLSEKNCTGGAGTFLRATTVYLIFYVPLSFALFFIGRWFLA